jgi:hypothetical protein
VFFWLGLWLLGAELYPPPDSVLLQRAELVPLHWDLPGQSFRLEVSCAGRVMERRTLSGSEYRLKVEPGRKYEWWVRSNLGEQAGGRFEVAREYEFHCDGQVGTGEPGGRVEARLERRAGRMNLFLNCRHRHAHYVFVEPGVQFLITARGGEGRQGSPGLDVPNNPCRPGNPGGTGGWGGYVHISTVSCPWRDFLIVDVSGGPGGPGGRGGRALFSHVSGYDSPRPIGPSGPVGEAGKAGTVVTTIVQP